MRIVDPSARATRLWRGLRIVLVVVAAACGGDSGRHMGGSEIPPIPVAGDPDFGAVGHVLISDRGFSVDGVLDQIWIGFDDQDEWETFLELHARLSNGARVGGRLVADASAPLGFYFDPKTTRGAEVVAEGLEATLDFLKADPIGAEDTPFGAWFVPAVVEQIVPAG
jgi:hypothetical protein